MSTVDEGRINNAADTLGTLQRALFGEAPSRTDRLWHRRLVAEVLAADDKWLVNRTRVRDSMLRVHLGKAQETINELREKIKRRTTEEQWRRAAVNEREARLAKREAAAAEIERQAQGWQRASAAYVAQANILRQQLTDAGIEIDPRCK